MAVFGLFPTFGGAALKGMRGNLKKGLKITIAPAYFGA
jgi:hypothetical protein